MYCNECGNNVGNAKFCTRCGKAVSVITPIVAATPVATTSPVTIVTPSISNTANSLVGYWLGVNSTDPSFAEISNQGIKIITQYKADGTGRSIFVDNSYFTTDEGTIYRLIPFTWTCDGNGHAMLNVVIDGNLTCIRFSYQISGALMVVTSENGHTATDSKLPDGFEILVNDKDNDNDDGESTAKKVGSVIGEVAVGIIEGIFDNIF